MKVKEFWEEHKGKIETAAIVGGVIANCVIWYKVGRQYEFKRICKAFGGGMGTVLNAAQNTNNLYVRTIGPDDVKFKDLGKLAKDAVEFDPSHLEDTIKGVFVFTKHET